MDDVGIETRTGQEWRCSFVRGAAGHRKQDRAGTKPGAASTRQDRPEAAAVAARRLRRLKLEVQVKAQAGLMQEALSCAHSALSRCEPDDKHR